MSITCNKCVQFTELHSSTVPSKWGTHHLYGSSDPGTTAGVSTCTGPGQSLPVRLQEVLGRGSRPPAGPRGTGQNPGGRGQTGDTPGEPHPSVVAGIIDFCLDEIAIYIYVSNQKRSLLKRSLLTQSVNAVFVRRGAGHKPLTLQEGSKTFFSFKRRMKIPKVLHWIWLS